MRLNYKENTLKTAFVPTLAAGSELPAGQFDCEIVRTAEVTIRATIPVNTEEAHLDINLYYSPDGVNYDTVPYTYRSLLEKDETTAPTNTTIQRTWIIDPIEHGWFKITVQNNAAGWNATNVSVWTNVARWGDEYLEATKYNKLEENLTLHTAQIKQLGTNISNLANVIALKR